MSPKPRPDIEGLPTYATSDTSEGRIFLHANENPYPLPDAVMKEITDEIASLSLNRYPESTDELRDELAGYAGVDPEWVWIGDGSNEVLLQACLAYGGPGRTALVFEPTYRMHYRQARMAGTGVIERARAGDHSIDVTSALRVIEEECPDVVFVCTPNNPTGSVTPKQDVLRIAASSDALVVVDEAYFEFSGDTVVDALSSHGNVLVARTLSKAFRLAGVRLGYGIADPSLLAPMRAVRLPYAQSALSIAAAKVVLRRRAEVLETVGAVVAERDRLGAELAALPGVVVYPSGANFVFFRHDRAAGALAALRAKGIVIRDFSHLPGCEGCLRVTAGLASENDAFLETLSDLH